MEHPLMLLIVLILILQYGIDCLLDYLNARHFDDPVPAELQDVYDEETYRRSQRYKRQNYRFGLVKSGFGLLLTLALLILGGFDEVDQWARSFSHNEVVQALVFFGVLMLGTDLLSTPFSYYRTFVIEARFGFNKTTPRLFFLDKLRGWLLMILLGGPILGMIVWFYQWAGPDFWWYAWAIVALFTLFLNFFYSRLIVPLFNKQTPLENGSLREKIENFASRVGFRLENIYVIDGSKRSTKANAYFSGFGKEKRITLYDTLINDLEEEEVVAVLAHEVGHYKKNHMLFGYLGSVLSTGLTLYLLSLFAANPELSLAVGVETPSFHAALLGFGLLYGPVSTIIGLLMNYLSRTYEFQADAYAREHYRPHPLVSSLKKLSRNSLSNLTPHPAYVFMHYSHPPLRDRIRELQA